MKNNQSKEIIHRYFNKGDFSEIDHNDQKDAQNDSEFNISENYRPLNQAGDDWTTDSINDEQDNVTEAENEYHEDEDHDSQFATLEEFSKNTNDVDESEQKSLDKDDDNDESKNSIPKTSILHDPRIELVEQKLKENCQNFDKIIDAIDKFLLIVQDRRKNLGDKVWSATVEQEVKLLVKKYKEKAMAAQNRYLTYQKIVNEKICELDYKHQQQKEDIKFWKSQTGQVADMIPELNKILHREQETLKREKQEIVQALEQFLQSSSSLSTSNHSLKHKKGYH